MTFRKTGKMANAIKTWLLLPHISMMS